MSCNNSCGDNALLINVDWLKMNSHLDENVNDKDVRISIKLVQDQIIQQVIGTCLFEALKEMIVDCTIDHELNSKYKFLLDEYLLDIFAWGVPAMLPIPLTYKIRNAGEIKTTSEGLSTSTLDDINYTTQWYKNKMDFYVQRAIKWLCCNTSCFPELCSCCECGWYAALSKGPSIPLNLKPIRKTYRLKKGYHGSI